MLETMAVRSLVGIGFANPSSAAKISAVRRKTVSSSKDTQQADIQGSNLR
jgi:hypothetical protein